MTGIAGKDCTGHVPGLAKERNTTTKNRDRPIHNHGVRYVAHLPCFLFHSWALILEHYPFATSFVFPASVHVRVSTIHRYTVESIFARAKYPERIRIGIVDQIEAGTDLSCDLPIVPCTTNADQALCKYRDQIDVYEMEAGLAVGPTFARHVVQRMYRGEYYSLQIDSHTVMARHWDTDLIEQIESTNNEMAVLTHYLDDARGAVDTDSGHVSKESRMVVCNANYEGSGRERRLRHDLQQQPDVLPAVEGVPQLQPYFSSDFAFSQGHFVLTVPYDPSLPMVQKEDEEISMAIRAFTNGYDFYTPRRSVAFDSSYDDRDHRKSFLQNRNQYKG